MNQEKTNTLENWKKKLKKQFLQASSDIWWQEHSENTKIFLKIKNLKERLQDNQGNLQKTEQKPEIEDRVLTQKVQQINN